MMENTLVVKSDFTMIGQVAEHCNWDQLSVYIIEQQNLSLLPKIGQCLYNKIVKYLDNEIVSEDDAEVLRHIWEGGNYVGCNGAEKVHFGLKRMLIHYAYGAYVYRHGYVDTPFGVVQKMHQDSVPAPMKELRSINKEHRSNAEYYWEMTKDYICSQRTASIISECYACGSCSCRCGYCSGKGGTKQRRGITFNNITK